MVQDALDGKIELIIANEILANIKTVQAEICNMEDLETEHDNLAREMQVVSEMAKNAIRKNASVAQDQNEYQKRYDELVKQYEDTKAAYEKTVEQIESMTARNSLLNSFSKELRKQENILTEFDEGLWGSLMDFMTIHNKEDIEVTFRRGFGCTDFFILASIVRYPVIQGLINYPTIAFWEICTQFIIVGQYNRCNRLNGVIVLFSLSYRKVCLVFLVTQ